MRRNVVLGLLVTMALIFGTDFGAFARQKGDGEPVKGSITVVREASIGGQALEAGKYTVEITGGTDALLVVWHDKKEIARTRVRRTELASPAKYDRLDVHVNDSGEKEVAAVYFKGESVAYQIVDDQGVVIVEKP